MPPKPAPEPAPEPAPVAPEKKRRGRTQFASVKLRFESLGEEKFNEVVTRLLNFTPPTFIARWLHEEGHFTDVLENTLARALFMFRKEVLQQKAEGEARLHGAEIERRRLTEGNKRLGELHENSMEVLQRMIWATNIQRDRIIKLYAKEIASAITLTALDRLLMDYMNMLGQIQKAQFELGVNEFRGPLTTMRGVSLKQTLPDGTQQEKHVYEAVTAVEEIFRKRGIVLDAPAQLSNASEAES